MSLGEKDGLMPDEIELLQALSPGQLASRMLQYRRSLKRIAEDKDGDLDVYHLCEITLSIASVADGGPP